MSFLPPVPDSRPGPLARPLAAEWVAGYSRPSPFLEYWNVLRNNFVWVTSLAFLGLAAGWLFATFQHPLYQAKTVLDIRSLNENFLNPRDGSSTGTTESVLPESYIQTEIKILQSESIRKRALDQIRVPPDPPASGSDVSFWDAPLAWLKPLRIPMKNLVQDAGRRVKVRAVGNTRIVEVYCDARDGLLAASLCNTLAHAYIENNTESRYASTKETSDWLQSQLDDVRKRLTKAENDLNDVAKASDVGLTSEVGDNPVQEKLRELQTELSRSQEERIVKESNYAVASHSNADSLPSDLDSGPIREYRMHLADLRRQLDLARTTMTPQHAKVRELTTEVNDLESALQQERDDLVSRLRADLDAAVHRESAISAAYNAQAAQVSLREDKAVRYNMVKRDVDSERRLYETLLQKVDEVGLAAAMRTSTITVVDPATPPATPYSPNVLADVGIGFLGGGAIGLGFALIRFRSDRTLRLPGEAALHLPLRELGVIPSVRGRGLRLMPARTLPTPVFDLALGADGVPTPPPPSAIVASYLQNPGVCEAFFATTNSLLLGDKERTSGRVIILTSPEARDGKTTVATNLAIALAQIGRRVVLVDGDLRKPRLHALFDEDPDNGLARLLEEPGEISRDALKPFLRATRISNLHVIPTRPVGEGLSRKLHSARLRSVVEHLRGDFDIVLVDSPPVLHISDARVFGALADGVLLVFRARKTTRESALAVYDCLIQDGVRILGTILNDWNPRKGDRYAAYSSYFRAAS